MAEPKPKPKGKPRTGMPVWAWALIVLVIAGAGYLYWRKRSASQQANAPQVVTVTGSTPQQAASAGAPAPNAAPQDQVYPQVLAELTSTEYALAQMIGAAQTLNAGKINRRSVQQYVGTLGGIQPGITGAQGSPA